MTDLSNKTVVITGSSNGLGKALAVELYRQNCNLALIDIDTAGLKKLQNEFSSSNQKITIHTADISDQNQVIAARQNIINEHKSIDILINNAGVSISRMFEDLDIADYKWLFDINFWGTIYCTKHFLPDLKKEKDSRLINIISGIALMGFPGKTAYGSSKSAIMGFTNSLETELMDTNVKVSLVIPPALDTNIIINSKHIDENKKQIEAAFLKAHSMRIDLAARKIILKVKKGKYRIIVGAFSNDILSRLFPSTLNKLIGKYKKRIEFI